MVCALCLVSGSVGLWQVPPQWKALRRVPGWSYSPSPIARLTVPHQHLYPLIFERLPILRLEGHRLGEIAVGSTGSNSSGKTLTQRMVLRWWQLMRTHTEPNMTAAFERVRTEFEPHLQQFAEYLTRTKAASASRHAQLAVAKSQKDARDVELGRPERYAEHLELLVNRALNRHPNDPHQYFSPTVSRKLIKIVNKEKLRARLTTKTEVLKEQLELSALGKKSAEIVAGKLQVEGGEAATSRFDSASGSSAIAQPLVAPNPDRPISAFPTDATGEPIPSPELFYQIEKEWSTTINNEKDSIGAQKDRRVTELMRHIDEMIAEPDATLADYLAYVLHTQIITMQAKQLQSWLPYTNYLNHRIFFHAYRLLHTGVKRSSVVLPEGSTLMPKVRHYRLSPKKWTFQQSVTHQRLLILVQNHLTIAPLHSYREDEESALDADEDSGYQKPRELPLTPFWQEVMDEKLRIKHPGESWYNARLEETIRAESEDQEQERLEREAKGRWIAERAKAAAAKEAQEAQQK
jgi:hypothetical protein